jgi:hypothetical protein
MNFQKGTARRAELNSGAELHSAEFRSQPFPANDAGAPVSRQREAVVTSIQLIKIIKNRTPRALTT